MDLVLVQFDDGSFGYKGIDKHKKPINKQKWNESREDFFNRIGQYPKSDEYGYNETLDKNIIYADDIKSKIDWIRDNDYGLNKFLYDDSWEVRRELAKKGYRLDILVNDSHPEVRLNVAYQGYELDQLSNDEHYMVRRGVAEVANKYNRPDLLDKLINDKDRNVKYYAEQALQNKVKE